MNNSELTNRQKWLDRFNEYIRQHSAYDGKIFYDPFKVNFSEIEGYYNEGLNAVQAAEKYLHRNYLGF